jgi:hypothetical protein
VSSRGVFAQTGPIVSWVAAVLLAGLTPTPAFAADDNSALDTPPPPGWVLLDQKDNQRRYLPPDESADGWTQLVDLQSFKGFGILLTANDLAESAHARLLRSCPQTTASAVELRPIGKTRGAFIRMLCPDNGGRPLAIFQLSWLDGVSLEVRQVIFRRTPNAEDEAFAMAFIEQPSS